MVRPALGHSILGRASANGLVEFEFANPRDFCHDRHLKVDDKPFGGEPGMLIRAEPVARAVEWLQRVGGDKQAVDGRTSQQPTTNSQRRAIVLTAPTGRTFDQAAARELAQYDHVIFLCGHYEGIDHRVEESLCTHVFSIGDYVLTNGELPALIMADAVVRLLPGVLGSSASLDADSFSDGLLSAPNYTRPESWRAMDVPPVLLSGDHKKIAQWRRAYALRLTRDLRPDLLARTRLTKADLEVLTEN
ncbi:tRNA (guanosine(37)-N1)-methyltransferase TrmD [bacterium]|nr:MAG: tRNA (guanosine(37)-N1)-methyltransferase TrmD [bacterium]